MDGFSITFAGLVQSGATGLVFVIVMLVMYGNLVTKKTLERELDQERRIAEIHKAAHERSEASRDKDLDALKCAIQGLETVNYLVRQLRALGEDSANAAPAEK